MSHSGSGQSVSEDSTESQSGSTNRRKTDFGRKHRKIVRILTVVAYIISVSTAAVLLSAYYVFLWNPTKPSSRPTDSPSTMAMASIPQTSAYVGLPSSGLPLISFATAASQSFSFASSKHPPSSHRASKSPVSPHVSQGHGHDPVTPHPVIPTPQTLIMQTLLDSTTIISTPPAPPAAQPAIPTSHILTPQKPTKTNPFPSGQNTTATTATTNTTNTTSGPSATTSTTTTKPTAKSNRPTNKLRIFQATTNSLDLATNTNSTLTH